jgi:hypothetical protein
VTAQAPDARVTTDLQRNAVGLPGVVMQGVATIAPAFAILASFVFTVSLAGITAPLAYLFAGVGMLLVAISVSQLAKAFPSAGGWYTWIARSLHPRAGFLAGWIFSIWLPPVGVLTFAFFSKTVLEPALKSEYGITVPWWIVTILGLGLVAWATYAGISISEKLLIITGSIEIVIMLALAITGFLNPGPGGFSFAPLNLGNAPGGSGLFTAIVFSIFAFSGWEAVAPLAEESKNPRRNVPIGLIASVIILTVYSALDRIGRPTGIDLFALQDLAEEHVRPALPRQPVVDRITLTQGYAGVPGSFLLHAQRVAERFGVDPRDLIVEVGRLQAVAGQEDLLIEIAARRAAAGRSPSAG